MYELDNKFLYIISHRLHFTFFLMCHKNSVHLLYQFGYTTLKTSDYVWIAQQSTIQLSLDYTTFLSQKNCLIRKDST